MDNKMDSTQSVRLEDFFAEFEKQSKCLIPEVLKNILHLMEHTKLTISKLTDEDIKGMEESLADILEDLDIPLSDRGKYLGRFSQNPRKFRLLPGNKLTLKELIKFAEKQNFLAPFSSASQYKRKMPFEYSTNEEKGKY